MALFCKAYRQYYIAYGNYLTINLHQKIINSLSVLRHYLRLTFVVDYFNILFPNMCVMVVDNLFSYDSIQCNIFGQRTYDHYSVQTLQFLARSFVFYWLIVSRYIKLIITSQVYNCTIIFMSGTTREGWALLKKNPGCRFQTTLQGYGIKYNGIYINFLIQYFGCVQ